MGLHERPQLAHYFRTGTDQERQQWVGFGPFAKPSANDRSLREAAGWNRREAVVGWKRLLESD
jgi:hypothetical protein